MIRPVQKELYAVIGHPVRHSLSPAMMNAAFASLDLPAVYLALEIDDLARDLDVLAQVGFRGLSVTLPHKETAYRLARGLDETAEAIGAVNTLRWSEDGWEGRNTDWIGSNRALTRVTPLAGKRAVVIGAGGAARAVVFGLAREGGVVTVANRSIQRGEALARAFACDFIPLSALQQATPISAFDIVVQCTSVGLMGKDSSPLVSEAFFQPGMVVMDTVYRPLATPFLRAAASRGCTIVTGLEMLLHQGVAQLEWWFGRAIPEANGVQIMDNVLKGALEHD